MEARPKNRLTPDNGQCPLHVARELIDIDQCIGQYIDQGTVKDT